MPGRPGTIAVLGDAGCAAPPTPGPPRSAAPAPCSCPRSAARWPAMAAALGSYTAGLCRLRIVYSRRGGAVRLVRRRAVARLLPAQLRRAVLLVRGRARHFHRSTWLDGLVAGLAAAAFSAAIAYDVLISHAGGEPIVVAVNLAYPIADLLLITTVVCVFGFTGWRPGRAWLLLGLGMLGNCLADGIYLVQAAHDTYVQGTWLDAVWPARLPRDGPCRLAAAPGARRPRRRVARAGDPVVSTLVAVGRPHGLGARRRAPDRDPPRRRRDRPVGRPDDDHLPRGPPARRDPPPGADRRPHRPAQPPRARPRALDAEIARGAARPACCSSTSTASRSSTTRSATTSATLLLRASAPRLAAGARPATCSRGSAATSSPSCSRDDRRRRGARRGRRAARERSRRRSRSTASRCTSTRASASPSSRSTPRTRSSCCKHADVAMYQAKRDRTGVARLPRRARRAQPRPPRRSSASCAARIAARRARAALPAPGRHRHRPASRRRGARALAAPDARRC